MKAIVSEMAKTWDDVIKEFVKTLEGDHIYKPYEDILIKGVHGELYPCKRDIFFETYEEAGE